MRSSDNAWWHPGGGTSSHRLIGPIILLTLATVGTLLYLIPSGPSGGSNGPIVIAGRPSLPSSSAAGRRPAGTPSPHSTSPTSPERTSTTPTGNGGQPTPPPTQPGDGAIQVVQRITHYPVPGPTVTRTQKVPAPAPKPTPTPSPTPQRDKSFHCWDFKWQQDAQAAYVANLSDPTGLDGDPGPYNGDGIACSTLPVDPSRSPSKPVGAYQPPAATAAVKSALVNPQKAYWGVMEDGLPRAQQQYNRISNEVGKAPSSVGFFATFDDSYPAAQVQASWQNGALPVVTWMSEPSSGPSGSDYSLTSILAGKWDNYLYRFAGDIVRTNLPVAIRFDHEMNGTWYPWSAGRTEWNNSPAKYVAVWRHVWNIFEQVGANDDAIWLFCPSRVDNISKTKGTTLISDDYPGDQYVDWVGATVYWRNGAQATDYNTSFGKTIAAIRGVTGKPLFFPEIGALESYHGADVSAAKQDWIRNTIQGFLADPTVVGFDWFNNVATTPDDPTNSHDWRFDASAPTLTAFSEQADDPRFAGGTMPDPTGK